MPSGDCGLNKKMPCGFCTAFLEKILKTITYKAALYLLATSAQFTTFHIAFK